MSIFPTTRIGRALLAAAVVTGAVKILPFLLQVFSLAGDELTELPPLTPAGTTRSFLLANPVTWFLAVAVVVYVALLVRDVVAGWLSPPPPPPRRSRASAARKPTTKKAPPRKAPPKKAVATRSAPRKTAPKKTASQKTTPRKTASQKTTPRKTASRR